MKRMHARGTCISIRALTINIHWCSSSTGRVSLCGYRDVAKSANELRCIMCMHVREAQVRERREHCTSTSHGIYSSVGELAVGDLEVTQRAHTFEQSCMSTWRLSVSKTYIRCADRTGKSSAKQHVGVEGGRVAKK